MDFRTLPEEMSRNVGVLLGEAFASSVFSQFPHLLNGKFCVSCAVWTPFAATDDLVRSDFPCVALATFNAMLNSHTFEGLSQFGMTFLQIAPKPEFGLRPALFSSLFESALCTPMSILYVTVFGAKFVFCGTLPSVVVSSSFISLSTAVRFIS